MFKKFGQLFISLMMALILSSCQGKAKVVTQKALPQNSAIQVYFNHENSQGKNYQEPYRQVTRMGDNLEQIYIDGINSAQVSIDLAVQELRLPNIAKSLVKKHQQGIKIRIILENLYNTSWGENQPLASADLTEREQLSYQDYWAFIDVNQDGKLSQSELNNRDAIVILRNSKIPLIDDTEDHSKGTGLMHHKFMVIDGKRVITGSANLTLSDIHGDFTNPDTQGNANNLLDIKSSELAQLFTEEFNYMWGDGVGGNKDSLFGINKPQREAKTITIDNIPVTVKFSPNSSNIFWENTSNGLINQSLNQGKKSIDLALFVFSEQNLVNTLKLKAEKKIKIRGLIDPEFAFRPYSEGLDMLGVALPENCRYELNNQPWDIPLKTVGIANLPKGDKLHHKFGVIDQKIVITGSHNWSKSANLNNDETLLIIESPLIAQHYLREFERLYQTSKLGLPKYLNQKIVQETQKCALISAPILSNSSVIINVNSASFEQLQTLPGIGEKLAHEIILERQKNHFQSLEDLQRVSGIGSKKLEQLRGKVQF